MTANDVTPEPAAAAAAAKYPMNAEEIYSILPHAYPFTLLDRVVSADGQHAVGIKNVSGGEWWAPGHFPGQTIMPGVLILESMAHLAGIVVSARAEEAGETGSRSGSKSIYVLAGFKRVRFREMVRPGDQLRITAEHVASASLMSEFRCDAHVTSTVVTEATLSIVRSSAGRQLAHQ